MGNIRLILGLAFFLAGFVLSFYTEKRQRSVWNKMKSKIEYDDDTPKWVREIKPEHPIFNAGFQTVRAIYKQKYGYDSLIKQCDVRSFYVVLAYLPMLLSGPILDDLFFVLFGIFIFVKWVPIFIYFLSDGMSSGIKNGDCKRKEPPIDTDEGR